MRVLRCEQMRGAVLSNAGERKRCLDGISEQPCRQRAELKELEDHAVPVLLQQQSSFSSSVQSPARGAIAPML